MPRRSTSTETVETVEAVEPEVVTPEEESAPVETVETDDQRRAAEKRAAAHASGAERDSYVDALLEERRGYVTRGLDDRVAQVDEQLALRGYQP